MMSEEEARENGKHEIVRVEHLGDGVFQLSRGPGYDDAAEKMQLLEERLLSHRLTAAEFTKRLSDHFAAMKVDLNLRELTDEEIQRFSQLPEIQAEYRGYLFRQLLRSLWQHRREFIIYMVAATVIMEAIVLIFHLGK